MRIRFWVLFGLDWIILAAVTRAPSAAFPLSFSTHVKLDLSVSVSV